MSILHQQQMFGNPALLDFESWGGPKPQQHKENERGSGRPNDGSGGRVLWKLRCDKMITKKMYTRAHTQTRNLSVPGDINNRPPPRT
jgi:hypothetical protein